MKKIILFIGIASILIFSLEGFAQQKPSFKPALREELVYGFSVFDGKSYSGGFIPETEDTIYLIAKHNNTLSAKKTLVYFWAITGKYMAGFKSLNEEVEGTLEVLKDGKVIKELTKEDNVLSFPEGYFGEKSLFYKGEEALEEFDKYKKTVENYYNEIKKYYEAQTEYRKKLNEFFEQIKKRREAGEEGALNIEVPKEPQPPKTPSFYVTEPKKDFILNLSVGKYQIRLRAKDETIVEGSEKNIMVFTSRRTGGIGYEITPGNRWTKKESCNDPAMIIYAAGENILYFRPYSQDEYNELYYNKLIDPQNEGREDNWKWVHTSPIKNVSLLFFGQNKVLEKIDKKPFYVKQISGPELGYNIIEYNEKDFPYQKPTFEGYQLNLSSQLKKTGYQIYMQKKDENTPLSKSERGIRLVRKENSQFLYYLSFLPLMVGAIVFIRKKIRAKA